MENYNIDSRPSLPMKWHKFLIYFSLWFSSIVNLLIGTAYFLYLFSDSFNRYIYSEGELLFAGISSVFCAVYAIIVRFKLANYRRSGPRHLLAYQILVIIIDIVICCMESAFSFDTLISSAAAAALTAVYYKKRSDLFVY